MSAPESADVVIVGAGVTGLSTARALVELGVRDVLVLDRATVGSGGSGKSSGIVRCHYGIRSLAAMAWHALPILEDAVEILGAESGYHKTGYLVGVGSQNIGSLRANVAMHRSIGIDVELVGLDAAQEMWPVADLGDFAEFAFEPRGGYGDGHQTALAFAFAARRGGARVRQNSGVVALEWRGEGVTGVRLQNGERVAAGEVVLAAGPWSVGLAAPIGVDLPIRSQRAQILLVDPGQPIENLPVFSDLAVAAVRAHGGDVVNSGRRQRPFGPRVVRSRRLPGAGRRRGAEPDDSEIRAALSRPERGASVLLVCRLL